MSPIDMRNPIVHMTLWNLIATSGLLVLLIVFNSLTEVGRAILFETMPLFLAGLSFWIFVAVVVALIGGVITGVLVWTMTFTALVSDRTIIYYFFKAWIRIGILLTIANALIAWWYVSNEQWVNLPLADVPRIRDVMLAVVWMVVVPLIGATRFIDDLKADPSRLRKRASNEKAS